MKTEKVVTLQGKIYMYPSEAAQLRATLIHYLPNNGLQATSINKLLEQLRIIEDMDIGDEVT